MSKQPGDPLMTSHEAQQYLAISRGQFWALVGAGDLPRVRIGPRTVRFRRSDVDRFVRQRLDPQPTVGTRG